MVLSQSDAHIVALVQAYSPFVLIVIIIFVALGWARAASHIRLLTIRANALKNSNDELREKLGKLDKEIEQANRVLFSTKRHLDHTRALVKAKAESLKRVDEMVSKLRARVQAVKEAHAATKAELKAVKKQLTAAKRRGFVEVEVKPARKRSAKRPVV